MTINSVKLHEEIESAGIPIYGVSADGRIDFKETATEEQQTLAQQIVDEHDPTDAQSIRRRNAINALKQMDFRSQAETIRVSNLPAGIKQMLLTMNRIEWMLAVALLDLKADDPSEE